MPRILRIVLYCGILAGLIAYGRFFHPFVSLQMCLQDPQKYDGTTISVGNEAVVNEVFPDGFTLTQMGKNVRVFGSNKVTPGDFITVPAVFHKPGWLEAQQIKVAKKRRAKIWLSVIPALAIIIFFFIRFRFDVHSLTFEER